MSCTCAIISVLPGEYLTTVNDTNQAGICRTTQVYGTLNGLSLSHLPLPVVNLFGSVTVTADAVSKSSSLISHVMYVTS